ncbi:unnamed protein product [Phytophthora fragariaefolia]|uniref:Unnamed protein product n=1 Tax=Phytophthora fragariaefolia TaxID=1490495 RepID=A0A9W6UC28_9STRA|nr:unnamed protein product [Phytophthora fragariaefolia]
MIFILFGLDIRDSMYKLIWVGPSDSYSFRMGSTAYLQLSPVIPSTTASNNTTMTSGWSSFLSRCDSITPFSSPGSTFFLSALLRNCRLNGDSETNATKMASSLVVIADSRADAIAWASCSLLFVSRRPPICQEKIVANFNHRYVFSATDATASLMAPVGSSVEKELLEMFGLLSFSIPLYRVTCGEGFQVEASVLTKGETEVKHVPNLYVCGSPSQHRSAFVGVEHPGVHRLLHEAWLTMDIIQWMNIRWGIRQNTYSHFLVGSTPGSKRSATSSDGTYLTTQTTANFSSFGQLYVILAVIDISLLLLHFFSSLEVLAWVLYPTARHFRNLRIVRHLSSIRERLSQRESNTTTSSRLSTRRSSFGSVGASGKQLDAPLQQLQDCLNFSAYASKTNTTDNDALLNEDFFYSFFSRSLYRNPRVVAATCVSQLLSWQIIQPNSVVWTWSDSFTQKLQAYMSSIRVWVLLLLLVNSLWSLFVAAQEERAYRIARLTYLTSLEILAIVAIVSFMLRQRVFSMCEIKWTLERQRLYDFTSFQGFLAHSNSFNPGLDSVVITPAEVLWVQYGPLVRIIGSSLGVLLLYSALKTFYFVHYGRIIAWVRRRRHQQQNASIQAENATTKSMPTLQDLVSSTRAQQQQLREPRYERSDLEVLLNCPVRAKSIIRNSMELEKTNKHGLLEATPSCALDFGVMVRNGEASSRICFWGVFTKKHKRIHLQTDDEPPSPRSRRRTSNALSTSRGSFSLQSPVVAPFSPDGHRLCENQAPDDEKPRKRRSSEL